MNFHAFFRKKIAFIKKIIKRRNFYIFQKLKKKSIEFFFNF
jgi:hypothetical protein